MSKPYSADGRQVRKDPVSTPNPNGSQSVTLGFPVLTVSDWVKDPEAAAQWIADLMNADAMKGHPK